MTSTTKYLALLTSAFDARKSYEATKDPENATIQKKLGDLRKNIAPRIAEIMLMANVNVDFINRAERSTARFNVYSAEKVVNIARALASVAKIDAYTKAILLSAKSLQENDFAMTHRDAVASCSTTEKTERARDKYLKRYKKPIAANTASTQSSSSINALQMFGVLVEGRDDANNVCYRVNSGGATTKALLKACSA